MIRIGISATLVVETKGDLRGYKRAGVGQDYIDAIVKNGALPILIPVLDDDAVIDAYLDAVDGLLISGGHDVSPEMYQEEPQALLQETWLERDFFDMKLIAKAEAKDMPILAICRGHQLLNVYHGGSLYQDCSYVPHDVLNHVQSLPTNQCSHAIRVAKDSLLRRICGVDAFNVNSFHHQMIKQVGNGLIVSAYADDGVVEAVEHPLRHFELGVQFHPEMTYETSTLSQKIFQAFIDACQPQ